MAEKLFYSMGEVAELFDVNQSLIRHWEKQFDVLRPKRNKKGNRLFSPQDVEYLKQIYHLVKERGMTLDGARKALRRHRADSGVPRDAELMERLQRIRSMLVEVREQLKEAPDDEVYSDSDADREPAVVAASEVPVAPVVPAEEFGAEPDWVEGPAPIEESEELADDLVLEAESAPAEAEESLVAAEPEAPVATPEPAPAEEPAAAPTEPAPALAAEPPAHAGLLNKTAAGNSEKSRRKKDDNNNELFAYYEQSLF